jgi:alpha-L-rhamnosidase
METSPPTSVMDCNAKWICSQVRGGVKTPAPAPYFRRSFLLSGRPVRATLQISALGLYECEINGRTVGDEVFAPGWTDYSQRVAFQSFDVTDFLHSGENVLGAILGDGWYCGHLGWAHRQIYGVRPLLIASLKVALDDGSEIQVVSDQSWQTLTGPILANDLVDGETFDARISLTGWSSPGFDARDWQRVLVPEQPAIALEPRIGPPVRRITEFPGQLVSSPEKPARIFDFGQNFAGRVRLRVLSAPGVTMTIRHGEALKADGSLYVENLNGARASDMYTCGSSDWETWEPKFTFHGFRYAEVTGLRAGDSIDLTGVVLHSDMQPTGRFSCSNPDLNQLFQNIVWSQRGNFLEIPTDCPQRDERQGWTGDALVFVRTAAFNYDVKDFFRKWLRDLRDAQSERGAVPSVVPSVLVGRDHEGGPGWSDAVIFCPWTIYRCYGDRSVLEENYTSMCRYLRFLVREKSKAFIRVHPDIDEWGGFGDWLATDVPAQDHGATPKDLIGTAFLAGSARILSTIADRLGHPEDAAEFAGIHESAVTAFRRRFVTADGLLVGGTQTAYVLALHFDLLPEDLREPAVKELVRDIRRRKIHLSTGFVGTPHLLGVLEKAGHLDLAYALLEQDTSPSWLYPVKHGATTIWERWDGWTPQGDFKNVTLNSLNHYAYGAVGAWMVGTVAGLELDPVEPGYQRILFRPRPGGSIVSAAASLDTAHGTVAIDWRLEDDLLTVHVQVPPGASARFDAPDGFEQATTEFSTGSHTIQCQRTRAR